MTHIFLHKKEEAIAGYQVPRTFQEVKDNKPVEVLDWYVPGYPACSDCNQHPAFQYDSKYPNQIKVLTCDHIIGPNMPVKEKKNG